MCIDCLPQLPNSTVTGPVGPAGRDGTNGAAGINGIYGGVCAWFKFNPVPAVVASFPGVGYIQANAANLINAIRLDIAYQDQYGNDLTEFIDSIDLSTHSVKSLIRLTSKTDETKYEFYRVTAIATAQGGAYPNSYASLTIVNVGASAASPWLPGDDILFCPTLSGDDGAGSGTTLLFSDPTDDDVVANPIANFVLKTATIPANTFNNNGDSVQIEVWSVCGDDSIIDPARTIFEEVFIAATAGTSTSVNNYEYVRNAEAMYYKITITRRSATELLVTSGIIDTMSTQDVGSDVLTYIPGNTVVVTVRATTSGGNVPVPLSGYYLKNRLLTGRLFPA